MDTNTRQAATPGPWKFYRDASGDRHIASETKPGLSLMCDTTYYPWCPDSDADWQLIAAAPELLAVAQMVVQNYDDGEGDEQSVARAARAAIRKAGQ
jgi:hypothetical protein